MFVQDMDATRPETVAPRSRRGAVVGGGPPLAGGARALAAALTDALAAAEPGVWERLPVGPDLAERLAAGRFDRAVYAPARTLGRLDDTADGETGAVLETLAAAGLERLVVLSSTEAYEPHHHHLGHVAEDYPLRPGANRIAAAWRRLEERAVAVFAGAAAGLVVLRIAPLPLPGGADFFSRLLARRWVPTLTGYDPGLQLLAPEDLAAAVRAALAAPPDVALADAGLFNVVPAGVVPLHRAIRAAGGRRLPLPLSLLRLLPRLAAAEDAARLEYLRYPWTAGGERARRRLGFAARRTSGETLLGLAAPPPASAGIPVPATSRRRIAAAAAGDDFGLDPDYVAAQGRTWIRFLHDVYWRIEARGVEQVPARGRAVLVGVHRGFMPYDGVMALHLLVREAGRTPRFLLHPTLTKFPFLSTTMRRLGGVMACQENAARILADEGLLAIFPEGIRGAFTPYRRAYRLGKFGRDEYVRMAIRNRAPLVPFVTVGSAEIYPILGRLDWSWFKRWTEWPYLPITPTFPLLPLPLPSKWHTLFLEPEHVERQHPPEAADDPRVVAEVSRRVRSRMRAALEDLRSRRRSIFFGSVFDREPQRPLPSTAPPKEVG